MAKPPKTGPGYPVGYGKPPRHSQFKTGQSGNPKGRPKGRPTASDIVLREAARCVRMQVGDKVETMTKLEVVIRKLFHLAMAGDLQAARMLLNAQAQWERGDNDAGEAQDSGAAPGAAIPEGDALRRILARFDHLRSE